PTLDSAVCVSIYDSHFPPVDRVRRDNVPRGAPIDAADRRLKHLRAGQREDVNAVQPVAARLQTRGQRLKCWQEGAVRRAGRDYCEDAASGAWPDGIVEVANVSAAADHLGHLRVARHACRLERL